MGDALARLRARLPAANDQAMASALNARAARTATAATPETNARASDPKYSIYFKMLKMGVPAQAVRNKMNLDGVDASVLDGR